MLYNENLEEKGFKPKFKLISNFCLYGLIKLYVYNNKDTNNKPHPLPQKTSEVKSLYKTHLI